MAKGGKMQKRILIVSQYFYPESFRINELAFELAKLGHHVDVLTAIPNYPEGKFYKGYGIFRKRKEVVNGVTIYRGGTFDGDHNNPEPWARAKHWYTHMWTDVRTLPHNQGRTTGNTYIHM